jgi:hypothetical protein
MKTAFFTEHGFFMGCRMVNTLIEIADQALATIFRAISSASSLPSRTSTIFSAN